MKRFFKPGRSLRFAFLPESEAELKQALAVFACPACGGERGTLDMGGLQCCGDVLYYEILKHCSCGFRFRAFAIVNEIARGQAYATQGARDALDAALAKGLIEDPRFEEAQDELLLAKFEGNTQKGIAIGKGLVQVLPNHPQAWYNLAWFFSEAGQFKESVNAYRRVLDLDPNFADAWHNLSLNLAQIGNAQESRRCLERFFLLKPEMLDDSAKDVRTLASKMGTFGKVSVIEDLIVRRLLIRSQTQSGAYLKPDAGQVLPECGLAGPGPLPESFYSTAWLLAGVTKPRGRGLMLGLGSGTGALAMLSNFEGLRLDIVDADRTVIELARQWFPLLSFFEKRGALNLVCGDAYTFLDTINDFYDFVIIDLYKGENEVPLFVWDRATIQKMHRVAGAVWLNLIGRLDEPYLHSFARAYQDAGHPFRFWSHSVSASSWTKLRANYIAATAPVDLEQARYFVPFPELDEREPALRSVRAHYSVLTHWVWSEAEIRCFAEAETIPDR